MNDIKTPKELREQRKRKLREMVERDLKGEDHEKSLKEWSSFADGLVRSALDAVLAEVKDPPQFCVLALGKLGGMELNYSSDIDLIYIYDGDFETASRVANRLTRLLGDVTEDGFVYRVDNNLRPLGKDGNIVNTVDSLERYYETTGQEWERQALLRARFVAGEMPLAGDFLNRISPFVFRRSIDIGQLKKIRATKLALERTADAEGWRNIKLGPGGIRETEFVVQAFQLLHGGKIKELRVTNTFDALDLLLKNKIISKKKHIELKSSYLLLRRVENMLQAKEDRQVHTLPKGTEDLEGLAKRLGFSGSKALIEALDVARQKVQRHFSELFDTSFEKMEILEAFEANLETCRSKEEIIDSLPWFKDHITKRIQEEDLAGKIAIDDVSERLTCLAEAILGSAVKMAREELLPIYGKPMTGSGIEAGLIVLGMGKLGAYEMDYASDLDLVFIYSGDGLTTGKRSVTNHEYFTKAAQKIISMITLPTRYGKAYNIDTELRPSGNQGALVTSLEAFERYHKREARLWERQALLRARVLTGDITLGNKVSSMLEELTYQTPLPHDLKEQIDELRKKVILENKPRPGQIDLKKGPGGIADIESIVHYLQLKNGRLNPSLREKRFSLVIKNLAKEGLIKDEEADTLLKAYSLFRTTISRTRLFSLHSTGTIDPSSDQFISISESQGLVKDTLIDMITVLTEKVKGIYRRYLEGQSA